MSRNMKYVTFQALGYKKRQQKAKQWIFLDTLGSKLMGKHNRVDTLCYFFISWLFQTFLVGMIVFFLTKVANSILIFLTWKGRSKLNLNVIMTSNNSNWIYKWYYFITIVEEHFEIWALQILQVESKWYHFFIMVEFFFKSALRMLLSEIV